MSEAEVKAEMDRLGPIVETHAIDCQCGACNRFMTLCDEMLRLASLREAVLQPAAA